MTLQPAEIYPGTGPDAPPEPPPFLSEKSRRDAEDIASLAKMRWARHATAGTITIGSDFDGVYVPLVVVDEAGMASLSEAVGRLVSVPMRADALSRDVEAVEKAGVAFADAGDVRISSVFSDVAAKLAEGVHPSQAALFDICAAGRHPHRVKTETLEAFVEMILGRRRKTAWGRRARSAAVPYPGSWAEDRLAGVLLELFNRSQGDAEGLEIAA